MEKVKQLHPQVCTVEVCGLVIGARGVGSCWNGKLWNEMGLPSSLNSSMLMTTLYGSVKCCHYFMHATAIVTRGNE